MSILIVVGSIVGVVAVTIPALALRAWWLRRRRSTASKRSIIKYFNTHMWEVDDTDEVIAFKREGHMEGSSIDERATKSLANRRNCT